MSTYNLLTSRRSSVTVDGHKIPPHLGATAIAGFVLIGLCFLLFLYMYISPTWKWPPPKEHDSPIAKPTVDTEAGGDLSPSEKTALLLWIKRRSRERFADTPYLFTDTPSLPQLQKSKPETRNRKLEPKRVPSFFSRISIVPHLAPSLPSPVHLGGSAMRGDVGALSNLTPNSIVAPSALPAVEHRLPWNTFSSSRPLSRHSKCANTEDASAAWRHLLNRASMSSLGLPADTTKSNSTTERTLRLHPKWISIPRDKTTTKIE